MTAGTDTGQSASAAGADAEPLVHILWMNGGLGCDGEREGIAKKRDRGK